MNQAKLNRLSENVRIGGKGSMRRKKKVGSTTSSGFDEKKLNTTLKKLSVGPLQGTIEEACIFFDQGHVRHFINPKVQGSQTCNLLVLAGSSTEKSIDQVADRMFSRDAASYRRYSEDEDEIPDVGRWQFDQPVDADPVVREVGPVRKWQDDDDDDDSDIPDLVEGAGIGVEDRLPDLADRLPDLADIADRLIPRVKPIDADDDDTRVKPIDADDDDMPDLVDNDQDPGSPTKNLAGQVRDLSSKMAGLVDQLPGTDDRSPNPAVSVEAMSEEPVAANEDLSSEAEPELVPELEPEPDLASKAGPEDLSSEAEPELVPELEPEPNLASKAVPEVGFLVDPDVTSEMEPEVASVAEPDVPSEDEPDGETEVASEVEMEVAAELEPEVVLEAKPDVASAAEGEAEEDEDAFDFFTAVPLGSAARDEEKALVAAALVAESLAESAMESQTQSLTDSIDSGQSMDSIDGEGNIMSLGVTCDSGLSLNEPDFTPDDKNCNNNNENCLADEEDAESKKVADLINYFDSNKV